VALLEARNRDQATAAVIVQLPTPARLAALVQRLDSAKDLDGLLKDFDASGAALAGR
jgi:5,10-methylene-tetrahydrofolate dehydrogenase/methenyl tetrahydrofolate cyclohydrolase